MKVLLLPLDERPCNYFFPQMIAKTNLDFQLVIPPLSILGQKKKSANFNALEDYIFQNIEGVDYLILSIDMLVYGGLIPSRLHHDSFIELKRRLDIIPELKKKNPNLKIYAFNCIMRAPSYNSSEEEPDYYEDHGYALFRRKYLMDYQSRHGLLEKEKDELKNIQIPQDIIDDYENRRNTNSFINLEVVKMVEQGNIDFLVIPQDDSSPYGYTAISQKMVVDEIKNKKLSSQIMIYPGADEVGLSLMARAYNDYHQIQPKIYAFYASTLGPTIIPNYEDRPMYESLKSHVRVCHATLVDYPQTADFILAINAPGRIMQEAFVDPGEVDITYTSFRQLLDFTYKIKEYIDQGYKVALCDGAFSNGGDLECIQYLDQLDVLDQLISYAGWNTHCNTLGTTLSQAMIGKTNLIVNLCYRLIEDVFYQSYVRKDVVEHELVELGLSYYDFKNQQSEVEQIIKNKLLKHYQELELSKKYAIDIQKIYMPWKRMFEIGMNIEVEKICENK